MSSIRPGFQRLCRRLLSVGRPMILASILLAVAPATVRADRVNAVAHPPTDTRNEHYAGYREPLRSTPLVELPVGAVKPRGWLRKQLELQAAGFHGHLGEISRFLNKEGNGWLSPQGTGDHGWEEVPYWLKGYILTAYLLDDPEMIKESQIWIDGALDSLQPDGWFGPRQAQGTVASTDGKYDLWPNMVMLFCLQAYYEQTGDVRVLDLMKKYFRWELQVPDEAFLTPYWQQQRGADNLYSVYWLYNRTGDKWLLDLATKIHVHTAKWTDAVPDWHNVNMSQAFGGPTTYYIQSGDEKHLFASYRNYDEIRSKYGQVPGGMFGGDENCREGYIGPRQAIETCGMIEMMLSHETLVNITGDPLWADRCEDVAFNSLPAAVTADLRALRYLTAPNMPLSDAASKSPGVQNGGPMFLMDPNSHRCCQHNFGHGWPYFITHLWSATPDNGLAAVLYGACELQAKVADGTLVKIGQQTHYPFEDRIEFTVDPAQDVSFPLYLRIPQWCVSPQVTLNGERLDVATKPLQFLCIDRVWRSGDKVVLQLPMRITLRQWKVNQDSVSVDRGPLTYSLKIGERLVRIARPLEQWPAWEIHPTTPWNYGLMVNEDAPAESFDVVTRPWPENDMPFTLDGVPIELTGQGKRIPQWKLDGLGLVGELQPSPVKSSEPAERLTLVPMGAARLRITAFPVIGDGPEANEWKTPSSTTASHCFENDSLRALSDRKQPRNSNDHSIPRMTWWNHRGTTEWVQYSFEAPRHVSGVRVYWFDDRVGGGSCAVPAAWRVLYQSADGQWKPVAGAAAGGVEQDQFNDVSFDPIDTPALRLEVQLRDGLSGGILEWEVVADQ